MKDYLKQFATIGQYESWLSSNNYIEPNVSLIENEGITYNPIAQNDAHNDLYDYSQDYLTFTAVEDTTFTFTISALQYSLDDGNTWTELAANTASPIVTTGNKILYKANKTSSYPNGIGKCSATGNFTVAGNIMSLLYGDNFTEQTDLTGNRYAFISLFTGNIKLVDAENLILPATTLTEHCYESMFYGCTSLTTAPELPATTLAQACYSSMFSGCTSLTTAPKTLPATTLVAECYANMFQGCSSLSTAPVLPATTLANQCYSYMFKKCSALITAPALPATTLVENCYQYMFERCTSLTTAPELPATILAERCYNQMFKGCTSLTTAPELPATTLAITCYQYMFQNCTSLTTAPELPATTLVSNCYQFMFSGCTSLNYIKCLAIDISVGTYDWVNGVAATGTFVKAASTDWSSKTGSDGIPSGWTVQDAA